jgi:hypothetical protein
VVINALKEQEPNYKAIKQELEQEVMEELVAGELEDEVKQEIEQVTDYMLNINIRPGIDKVDFN